MTVAGLLLLATLGSAEVSLASRLHLLNNCLDPTCVLLLFSTPPLYHHPPVIGPVMTAGRRPQGWGTSTPHLQVVSVLGSSLITPHHQL